MEIVKKKIIQKKKKANVEGGFVYVPDDSVNYNLKVLLKSNIVNLGHFDVYDPDEIIETPTTAPTLPTTAPTTAPTLPTTEPPVDLEYFVSAGLTSNIDGTSWNILVTGEGINDTSISLLGGNIVIITDSATNSMNNESETVTVTINRTGTGNVLGGGGLVKINVDSTAVTNISLVKDQIYSEVSETFTLNANETINIIIFENLVESGGGGTDGDVEIDDGGGGSPLPEG
jgi:hypothetical protein